ncbi:hypothetical protein LAZ67_1000216 [Cordylochernes scorpioides]|uniref:Cadherin domain-containing protein n=1 Tax=Cordylochernes scorpioides TaxID=51811 RepID=A0ABY6JVY7_9ARAC|nr:hypothetical protein LAZ67_1000216 [Cordylochernes scorpioides]
MREDAMSLRSPPPWLRACSLLCLLLSPLTQCLTPEEDLSFTNPVYNGSIAENSIGKTYVITSQRMGIPVTDPSLTIRYKIVSGDDQKYFKAETRRIGDFCLLLIRTRTENFAVLNREYQDLYILRVRASATSLRKKSVKLKAQTEVYVTVLDTNDLNPLFDPSHYDVAVNEDMPLHQSIIQVSAFDADIGINGEMYYSFLERTQIFAIHPSLGTITLTRHLDYQNQSSHTLIVVVEDRGPKFRAGDLKASSATVKINVTPVNLHAPDIIIRQLPNILEDSDPDIYAIVTVEDKDKGIHGEIDYLKIVDGDPDNTFRVVKGTKKNEYNIIADHVLHLQGYSLVLQTADKGTPPKTSTSILHIRQSDNRNQMPIFDQSDYEVIIDEVAPVNTPLVIVKAFDPRGKAIDLIYNIETGNDGLTFSINSKTGLVSTAKPLDRESKAYYSLTVSAIDKNLRGMRKKGSTIVNIQVLDCNDNDPVFNTSFLTLAFNENRPIGSLVFTAHAIDIDEKDNGYVTYSIANLTPVPFKIDHFSGEIKTTEILDYETMKRDYILKIRASDWGSPFRRQAEMILKIKLKDINDHRPSFEKVDCISYVSKHAFPGTEIFTFSAIDFDAGSVVVYKMVPSNDDSCFSLDSKTGILSVTCDLSHQHFKERVLNVSATDGTHFAETMSIIIKIISKDKGQRILERDSLVECKDAGVTERLKEQIRIGEANNRKYAEDEIAPVPSRYAENKYIPEFASSLPNEISINESLPVGSVVTVLQAQDHDTSYNGKLVYVISSGNEDSCFKMDLYTGKLLILSELDRERKGRYVLNITAFDLGQPQKYSFKTVVVNILDVNDNPPRFEKNSYFIEIPEDSPPAFSLLRLLASDEDAGRNAEMRFSILTDTEDFTIDPERGVMSVRKELDRERQEIYELTVQVTDLAATNPLSSTAVVTVKLTDVNDNSPHFERQPYWVKVREDLPMGTVILILTASDPDIGTVQYAITGGAEGKFEIDPEMGTLRLVHALDFARKQLYNVTVTARDDGSPYRETQAAVLVEVEPVREAARPGPKFPDVVLEYGVPENAPIGTEVGVVNVSNSQGSSSQLHFAIRDGDGMGLFSIDNQGKPTDPTWLKT